MPDNGKILRDLWLRYRFGVALGLLDSKDTKERADELELQVKQRGLFNEGLAGEALEELFEELSSGSKDATEPD